MSNSTQNDWNSAFREKFEGDNVPLNSVHPMMIDSQIIYIQKLLADARKEVLDIIQKEVEGGEMCVCEKCVLDLIATLREEEHGK